MQLIHPIVIPMEDDLVHTPEHPYCDDPLCPCHADLLYRELVERAQKTVGCAEEKASDE